MEKLEKRKIIKYSIINTIVWVSVFFFLGYFTGKGMETIKYFGTLAITLSIITFIIVYMGYIVYKKFRNGSTKQKKG
jgi:membrane protein DedA with SNARE-associated domain